jgi:hypothetical protein
MYLMNFTDERNCSHIFGVGCTAFYANHFEECLTKLMSEFFEKLKSKLNKQTD